MHDDIVYFAVWIVVGMDVVVGMITVGTVGHHPHITTVVDLGTLVHDLTALVSTIESTKFP